MRYFVIIGQTARADSRVRLDDLAGTSGRLDVLVRCIRAAFCVSHGVRKHVVVFVVLLGGEAPRTVRIDGSVAKFIRPDERALATLLLKAVERHTGDGSKFVEQRHGISVASAGLDAVIATLRGASFVLEEGAPDARAVLSGGQRDEDFAFWIGDHLGFDEAARGRLAACGARAISVGPVSLHSDDVVTLVSNELDRVTSTA